MLSKKNKAKLKEFLISSAEYIFTGTHYFHLYSTIGRKDIFPSILMTNLLGTEFTHFSHTGNLNIICKDAVKLYKRGKADFLDLLIFCAIHGLDKDRNQNFWFHDMCLYNFNEKRGLPYEYCDDKNIRVSMGFLLEHDVQELADIARGVIWYLTNNEKPCKCHINGFGNENDSIESSYWKLDARFFFSGKRNLIREDMRLKGRLYYKDGICTGEKCSQCNYFEQSENPKYGSCDYEYESVCRIILLPYDGNSVACSHFNKMRKKNDG